MSPRSKYKKKIKKKTKNMNSEHKMLDDKSLMYYKSTTLVFAKLLLNGKKKAWNMSTIKGLK